MNPLWCIVDKDSNGWNKTGLVLALVACLEKSLRSSRLEPQPPSITAPSLRPTTKENGVAIKTRPASGRPGLVACGFGSLLFLVQTFISDASTIIAWNWSGYPVRDQPTYMQHVPVVITCAAVAAIQPFALEIFRNTFDKDLQDPRVRSYIERNRNRRGLLGVIAFVACITLCSRTASWVPEDLTSTLFSERNGFIAGCVVVAYILQGLPRYFQGMSALRSYRHFGHAMLLHVMLDVLSVVTVAYAFVPGGQLLRERGGLVISVAFLLVVLGDHHLPRRDDGKRISTNFRYASFQIRRYGAVVLGLLAACSWIFQYRFQHGLTLKTYTRVSNPSKPESLFTAGIWTVSQRLRMHECPSSDIVISSRLPRYTSASISQDENPRSGSSNSYATWTSTLSGYLSLTYTVSFTETEILHGCWSRNWDITSIWDRGPTSTHGERHF